LTAGHCQGNGDYLLSGLLPAKGRSDFAELFAPAGPPKTDKNTLYLVALTVRVCMPLTTFSRIGVPPKSLAAQVDPTLAPAGNGKHILNGRVGGWDCRRQTLSAVRRHFPARARPSRAAPVQD